ncbi:UNVERIFIED_CONTAM: hypothetical protein K2H54_041670 [Gekko kuhli]
MVSALGSNPKHDYGKAGPMLFSEAYTQNSVLRIAALEYQRNIYHNLPKLSRTNITALRFLCTEHKLNGEGSITSKDIKEFKNVTVGIKLISAVQPIYNKASYSRHVL